MTNPTVPAFLVRSTNYDVWDNNDQVWLSRKDSLRKDSGDYSDHRVFLNRDNAEAALHAHPPTNPNHPTLVIQEGNVPILLAEDRGLDQGTPITCHRCEAVVLIAKVHVPYKAPDSSSYWNLPDGTPAPHRFTLNCPSCHKQFDGISTTKAKTEMYRTKWGY